MQHHLGDALLRYDFARDNLAAIDAHIQNAQLKAHIHAAISLSVDEQQRLAELLVEQADLSEKFGDSARAFAAAFNASADRERSP